MGVCHHGLGGNESRSSQASVAGRPMGFLCHLTAIVGSDLTLFFWQWICTDPVSGPPFRNSGRFGKWEHLLHCW